MHGKNYFVKIIAVALGTQNNVRFKSFTSIYPPQYLLKTAGIYEVCCQSGIAHTRASGCVV